MMMSFDLVIDIKKYARMKRGTAVLHCIRSEKKGRIKVAHHNRRHGVDNPRKQQEVHSQNSKGKKCYMSQLKAT